MAFKVSFALFSFFFLIEKFYTSCKYIFVCPSFSSLRDLCSSWKFHTASLKHNHTLFYVVFVFVCVRVCVVTLCAGRPEDSFCCHFIGIVYFYLRKALSLAWSWVYQPASARESTYVCLPGTGIAREHCPSWALTWVLREKNKTHDLVHIRQALSD